MRLILFIGFLAFQSLLHADVVWENKNLALKGELFAEEPLLYQYVGKNEGAPRKIRSVRASCPCIKILDYPKGLIESGRKFEVLAVLSPLELGGDQRYYLTVLYEDKEQKPDQLTLECLMPSLVTCSTHYLYWKKGSEITEQNITLKLHQEYDVKLTESYVMDENFSSQRKDIDEKNTTISITPRDTHVVRPATMMLKFQVNGKEFRKPLALLIGKRNPFVIDPRSLQNNRPQAPNYKKLSESFEKQSKLKRTKKIEKILPSESLLKKKESPAQLDVP